MRKSLRIILCLAIALFILVNLISISAQSASQNRSTISGYVFGPQRQPVEQVSVELLNEYNSLVRRVKTDGSGRFLFSGLANGRFTIHVVPLGTNLQEQSAEVEIYGIGVRGQAIPDNIQKDIYLRPRRSENPGVTGSVFAQEIPDDARKAFAKAMSKLHDKKISAAVEDLNNALELYPTYYLALEQLGQIYITQGENEKAIDLFSRAVAVNPRSFNGWYGVGYAKYILHRPEAAIEALQKAVILKPDSVDAFLILGLSLRQTKQFAEAENALKQANKLSDEKSPDAHWNLALLYAHNLRRYKDAAQELELYLKAWPDAPNREQVQRLIKQFRENPPVN